MDHRQNEEFTAHLKSAVREAERLKYVQCKNGVRFTYWRGKVNLTPFG
jgi:hypothetical protein